METSMVKEIGSASKPYVLSPRTHRANTTIGVEQVDEVALPIFKDAIPLNIQASQNFTSGSPIRGEEKPQYFSSVSPYLDAEKPPYRRSLSTTSIETQNRDMTSEEKTEKNGFLSKPGLNRASSYVVKSIPETQPVKKGLFYNLFQSSSRSLQKRASPTDSFPESQKEKKEISLPDLAKFTLQHLKKKPEKILTLFLKQSKVINPNSCEDLQKKEWITFIEKTILEEGRARFEKLKTPATKPEAWMLDFEIKLLEHLLKYPTKGAKEIVGETLQSSFNATTIQARVLEACHLSEADFPFLSKLSHLKTAEEFNSLLTHGGLSSLNQSVMKMVIGCPTVLERLTDQQGIMAWVSQIQDLKKKPEEANTRLNKLHQRELEKFKNLEETPIDHFWEKDLTLKLTEMVLNNPHLSPAEIAAKALEMYSQSVAVVSRVKEKNQKDGILYDFLLKHSFAKTDMELMVSLRKESLEKNKQTRESRVWHELLGNWELITTLAQNDPTFRIKYVKNVQGIINQFSEQKDKKEALTNLAKELCKTVQHFTLSAPFELSSVKIGDLVDSFRAHMKSDSHKSDIVFFTLNSKPLKLPDLSNTNDMAAGFLQWLLEELAQAAQLSTENCQKQVTTLFEAVNFSEREKFDAVMVPRLQEIPTFPVLEALSIGAFKVANYLVRNTLFPFFNTNVFEDLKLRYSSKDNTTFKMDVDPLRSTYSVTQTKSFVFFTGNTGESQFHAMIDVQWTIRGAFDKSHPVREAYLEFNNFRVFSEDESILTKMYVLLNYCLSQEAVCKS